MSSGFSCGNFAAIVQAVFVVCNVFGVLLLTRKKK